MSRDRIPNGKIRPLGAFEKNALLYVAMAAKKHFQVSESGVWGVVCIEKCFWILALVTGSAVSVISRFAQF